MSGKKSLLARLGETLDQNRVERHAAAQKPMRANWLRWLGRQMIPNIGTLLMVVVLLLTVPSLAAPLRAPSASSASTISYQGRLANTAGSALTGEYDMEFRLYNVSAGSTALWTEMWTNANAVDVSGGLFNVMLGSIDNTLASSIDGHTELYLGITVGTDPEMVPRVQLGSVPLSMQAMTVADGNITTEKIAEAAVTSAQLNIDNGLMVNGPITLTGTLDGPTSYWNDYRPYVRFLAEKGVTAADLCPEGGTPVGVVSPKQSLEWTTGNEICQHNNYLTTETDCVNVHQMAPCGSILGDYYPYSPYSCSEDYTGKWAPFYWWDARHGHNVSSGILRPGIGCMGVKYACCVSP